MKKKKKTLVKKSIMKILNLKLVILLEYQNIKTFLQKALFQNDLKKFLWLKKLKNLCCGHMLLVILKAKELLKCFIKSVQSSKSNTEKIAINYVKGYDRKAMIVFLTVELIKKTQYK